MNWIDDRPVLRELREHLVHEMEEGISGARGSRSRAAELSGDRAASYERQATGQEKHAECMRLYLAALDDLTSKALLRRYLRTMAEMPGDNKLEGIPFSVVHRMGKITETDYDEAIAALQAAKKQLAEIEDGKGFPCCAVCEDSDHHAAQCHHNPLVMARQGSIAQSVWRCYHCREWFTSYEDAEEHFGTTENEVAKCVEQRAARLADPGVRHVTIAGHGEVIDENAFNARWPMLGVLRSLIGAVDHLHERHDCDHHGYETVLANRDAAYAHVQFMDPNGPEGRPRPIEKSPEQLPPPPRQVMKTARRFQYGMHAILSPALGTELNKLEADGWEFVQCVDWNGVQCKVLLRREREDKEATSEPVEDTGERYKMEFILGTDVNHPSNWRITDTLTYSRIGTCYDAANARTIIAALNAAIAPLTSYDGAKAAEWVNRFFALKLDAESMRTLAHSLSVFEEPEALRKLAALTGGHIEEIMRLPDGSGAAVMSMPLPKDHWSIADPEGNNVPPAPLRIGTAQDGSVLPVITSREQLAEMLRAGGKYAYRCATMNGKMDDMDPDALLNNLVVGMLGVWTPDGNFHE